MVAVFLNWQDFESESMNEKDLLQFALDLWRDGQIKVSRHLTEDNTKITTYSIKCWADEER